MEAVELICVESKANLSILVDDLLKKVNLGEEKRFDASNLQRMFVQMYKEVKKDEKIGEKYYNFKDVTKIKIILKHLPDFFLSLDVDGDGFIDIYSLKYAFHLIHLMPDLQQIEDEAEFCIFNASLYDILCAFEDLLVYQFVSRGGFIKCYKQFLRTQNSNDVIKQNVLQTGHKLFDIFDDNEDDFVESKYVLVCLCLLAKASGTRKAQVIFNIFSKSEEAISRSHLIDCLFSVYFVSERLSGISHSDRYLYKVAKAAADDCFQQAFIDHDDTKSHNDYVIQDSITFSQFETWWRANADDLPRSTCLEENDVKRVLNSLSKIFRLIKIKLSDVIEEMKLYAVDTFITKRNFVSALYSLAKMKNSKLRKRNKSYASKDLRTFKDDVTKFFQTVVAIQVNDKKDVAKVFLLIAGMIPLFSKLDRLKQLKKVFPLISFTDLECFLASFMLSYQALEYKSSFSKRFQEVDTTSLADSIFTFYQLARSTDMLSTKQLLLWVSQALQASGTLAASKIQLRRNEKTKKAASPERHKSSIKTRLHLNDISSFQLEKVDTGSLVLELRRAADTDDCLDVYEFLNTISELSHVAINKRLFKIAVKFFGCLKRFSENRRMHSSVTLPVCVLSQALHTFCGGNESVKMSDMFNIIDTDNNGFITKEELKFYFMVSFTLWCELLPGYAKGISVEKFVSTTIKEVFDSADINSDDRISLQEFAAWYFGFEYPYNKDPSQRAKDKLSFFHPYGKTGHLTVKFNLQDIFVSLSKAVGRINAEQFYQFAHDLLSNENNPAAFELIEQIYNGLEKDKYGNISATQLLAALILCTGQREYDKAKVLFNLYDQNKNNVLSKPEVFFLVKDVFLFLRVLVNEEIENIEYLSEETVNEIFRSFDKNNDGFLSLQEFYMWYSKDSNIKASL